MRELFVAAGCPYCAEMRERLDWDGEAYIEHDIEASVDARERLFVLAGPAAMVPVLVEDGAVTQIGWEGRGCYVGPR